jgi:hypothetical protein
MIKRILLACLIAILPTIALAQSSPGFVYKQVPTAAQWNQAFANKQDTLTYPPVNKNGDTMLGPFGTAASASGSTGFNLACGIAPTSPNNGDMWCTSGGLYIRINGSTIGPIAATAVTSVGLSLPGIFTVSGLPVTSSGVLTAALASQSANVVFVGPSSGSAATPTFRALVGSDLPNPSASTLGGVESLVVTTHQWINTISTAGVPASTQPAFTDISGTAAVAQGGTGITSGTSGGVLAFTASGTFASSGVLTAGLPVIGGGAGVAPTVGTVSGNTTEFATVSGTLTGGHCVSISAGNFVDAGGVCTTGGGGGTVSSSTINYLAYYAASGTTVTGLATANNGTLITSGAGVPSISSTLPAAVQGNITALGTITTGVWNGTVIGSTYGGTGVNNGSSTITIGGSVTFSGAYTATLTLTNTTSVTLPTSGTLVNTAIATLSSLTSIGTIGTGTWQGSVVGVTYGGTGINGSSAANGKLLIGNGTGYTLANLTAGNNVTVTNGSGTISLASVPTGSDTYIAFNSSGAWGGNNGFVYDETSVVSLGVVGTSVGGLKLNNATSGYVELKPTTGALGTSIITFPAVTDTIAVLGTADQLLSGGANITSHSIGTVTSGTTTIDCGQSPLQYMTNGGASTIAAPSNDGSTIIFITNNASAGTITWSGFTEGANTGDTLTTVNGSKFSVSVYRVNGISHYLVSAYQ